MNDEKKESGRQPDLFEDPNGARRGEPSEGGLPRKALSDPGGDGTRNGGFPVETELDEGPEGEAYARSTDPSTSHAAADRVDANRLERRVLGCLRVYGALTVPEIAHKIRAGRNSVSPRMKPLEKRGLVSRTGETRAVSIPRICTGCGRKGPPDEFQKCIVWEAL